MTVRRHRWLVLIVVLVGVAGCAASPSDAGDDAALADTLSTLIADAYDFARPGTLERMIDLYDTSDRVVSASGGQVTASADSVRSGIVRFWEQAGQNMRDAEWRWDEVHVERLGGEAAVLTGTWSIPHIALDGQPHVIEGAWTAVFRRIGGEWKIVHEHLSAPPA
jgi:ketosteroid isomerase-like protein